MTCVGLDLVVLPVAGMVRLGVVCRRIVATRQRRTYMHFHLCPPSDLLFRIFPAADDDDDQYDNKGYGSDTDADYWTNYWAAVAIQSGSAATKCTVLQVPVYISGAVDSTGTGVALFCIQSCDKVGHDD